VSNSNSFCENVCFWLGFALIMSLIDYVVDAVVEKMSREGWGNDSLY